VSSNHGDIHTAGLLADRHDDTEPTLDDAGDELLPGDPFSLPDNPASQDGQDDDDDDDDAMPTNNMSSLEKSLQVGHGCDHIP